MVKCDLLRGLPRAREYRQLEVRKYCPTLRSCETHSSAWTACAAVPSSGKLDCEEPEKNRKKNYLSVIV